MEGRLLKKLELSLLILRLGVFLVFAMWTLDKFIKPDHAARVFEIFYKIPGLGTISVYVIGILQLVITVAFLLGIAKTWSYGAILVLHGVSTLSSYERYFNPFKTPNLLFFAAWPMLSACFVLFYLRSYDTLWTIDILNNKKQR